MKKHFTLIELIVVIAIIAILAAIIAPNAFKAIEKAKVAKAVSDFKTISTATRVLYADTARWPLQCTNSSWPEQCGISGKHCERVGESEMYNDPGWSGWDGPYLDSASSVHPWKGLYFFSILDDFAGGPERDIALMFDNLCPPYQEPYVWQCGVPDNAALLIDQKIDDGNVTSGEFLKRKAWGMCSSAVCDDYVKIILWDVTDDTDSFINCL
ncbi:MAG: prepilin-type N-terminal cleavage/methylation domain-containing protein [Candidatus Omnitrophica bacterium]|nr:prepilin-type N-terminal cleavage/methylation domain-containing protein [Candidatus Omnitrophota bacterium]MBU2251173.1 prepilin-type N-terminal cleavage/methylation domain-containing protein [Candidatus Omnitrophota bacterium]